MSAFGEASASRKRAKKRQGGKADGVGNEKVRGKGGEEEEEEEEAVHFEDAYEDEIDSEEDIVKEGEPAEGEARGTVQSRVWDAQRDGLQEGEELDFDESTYICYHAMRTTWPCLSFDVVRDSLGMNRKRFPLTAYIVAGTQADKPENNEVMLMKLSDINKTQRDAEDDEDSEDDDDGFDDDPVLQVQSVPHMGGVNRVRSMPQAPHIVATWADTQSVHVWDLEGQMKRLDGGSSPLIKKPVYTFGGHSEEGYAIDWSPVKAGKIATGDCNGNVFIWSFSSAAGATAAGEPLTEHAGSVEDIQWSPTEENVLATSGVDGNIKIWDARQASNSMLSVLAHETDVNVISWHSVVTFLVASGADDGSFKIWDLRNFKPDQPVAHFKYHQTPISSVSWHPADDSVLSVSTENQVTVWDMSLEEDGEVRDDLRDVPPQLLFVHQGQQDVKEIRFHPQVPGLIVSTAADGFNIWKPCNL